MKAKILAIMLTFIILTASASSLAGALETCGDPIATVDDSDVVIVTKKIVTNQGLVDEIEAEVGDIIRFNITITYHDSDGDGIGKAYKIKDIIIRDTLPSILEYDGNPTAQPTSISQNIIEWDLTGIVELFHMESYYLEFDTVAVHSGTDTNNVNVKALEKCISVPREVDASANVIVTGNDHQYYTLTVIVEGRGNVSIYPDDDIFLEGSIVELTAYEDEDTVFEKWSGDITGNENPVEITMNSNKTITAHFIDEDHDDNISVNIVKPRKHIAYVNNIPVRLSLITRIVGPITIKARVNSDNTDRVEFYIDGELKYTGYNSGLFFDRDVYSWVWLFKPIDLQRIYTIKVVAYDNEGNSDTDEITVIRVRSLPIINPDDNDHRLLKITILLITIGGISLFLKGLMDRIKNRVTTPGEEEIPVTEPTEAIIDGGPFSGIVGIPVEFDASKSTGEGLAYNWNFGDGSTGEGVIVRHIYDSPGTYTVSLEVIDNEGNTDETTTSATIKPAEEGGEGETPEKEEGGDFELFWYIVAGLSLLLLAIIGLLYVGGKFYE